MDGYTDSLTKNNQTLLMNNQRYDVDKFSISFTAEGMKCMMIVPKLVQSEIPSALISRKKPTFYEVTSPKRIYVCKGHLDVERLDESFYFVRVAEGGTLSDS